MVLLEFLQFVPDKSTFKGIFEKSRIEPLKPVVINSLLFKFLIKIDPMAHWNK